MTIDEAIRVAVDAHAGQLDKAGRPYILHPLRVMMTVEGPSLDSARKVADLRDNLDVTRLEEVTERDAKRISKYLRSLRRLAAPSSPEEAR